MRACIARNGGNNTSEKTPACVEKRAMVHMLGAVSPPPLNTTGQCSIYLNAIKFASRGFFEGIQWQTAQLSASKCDLAASLRSRLRMSTQISTRTANSVWHGDGSDLSTPETARTPDTLSMPGQDSVISNNNIKQEGALQCRPRET